jgi:type II secretory pathway pseudopilin PulG
LRPGHNRSGITLVELLIAGGLLALLAAIILPKVEEARKRTRRAEMQTNVRGIRTTLFATSFTDPGPVFNGAGPSPRTDSQLDMNAVPWVGDAGFDFLGYQPDGDVRCNYEINVDDRENIFVRAHCDVDNDDQLSELLMSGSTNPHLTTPNEVY